MLWRTN